MPDALTSAKALGGGLPIGALVTGPRLADALPARRPRLDVRRRPAGRLAPRWWRSSICSDPALLARVRGAGRAAARRAWPSCPGVVEVRGRGLMVGVDLADGISAPEIARRALLEQRLVVNATGPATIRLEPPLIVVRGEIDEALGRLGELLR